MTRTFTMYGTNIGRVYDSQTKAFVPLASILESPGPYRVMAFGRDVTENAKRLARNYVERTRLVCSMNVGIDRSVV